MRETYENLVWLSDAGQTGRKNEQEEHHEKGASNGGAYTDDAVGVDKIPQGRWKLLQDMPQLELTGAQTWEQGVQLASVGELASSTFDLQCGVDSSFAQYVKLVWSQAEKMYSDKVVSTPEVPVIRTERLDDEARLTSALLRMLPEAIKTPAVEKAAADDGCIASATLCKGNLSRLQPAGPEEVTSLLSFLRSPRQRLPWRRREGLLRRYNQRCGDWINCRCHPWLQVRHSRHCRL